MTAATAASEALARALARPLPLFGLIELAAEEACDALRAASLSISELDLENRTTRTIINVGILGRGESRWPDTERYAVDESANLRRLVRDLVPWTADLEDPDCDSYEADLLLKLGKGSSTGAPIVVDGVVWAEFFATRHRGQKPFGAHDLDYVAALMTLLGAAISRALRTEDHEAAEAAQAHEAAASAPSP
jgi:GAF domain-containing protein